MDKYNNEFESSDKLNDKLKLKPGFGEFYGGNQIHITRQNDKQTEKSKYKPFEGSGNLLNKKSLPNTSLSKNHTKITPYSSVNHYNRRYKSNVNNIKKPLQNYTNINDCDGQTIKKPSNKLKFNKHVEINTVKPSNAIKSSNKNSENGFCVFLIFISFFYICYLLHLANQKLYHYTGYKF